MLTGGLTIAAIYAGVKLFEKLMPDTDNTKLSMPDFAGLKDPKYAKAQAELIKNQKLSAKLEKEKLALQKAAMIFDMQRIQIIAALKGNISEDERRRLELQMALINEDAATASKLTYELAKSQGLTESLSRTLADLPTANNPFVAWKGYLDEIELQAKRIAAFGSGGSTTPPSTNFASVPSPDAVLAQASADFAAANQQIKIIVEGGDEVTSLMRFKIQEAAQSGSSTNWSQSVGAWDR